MRIEIKRLHHRLGATTVYVTHDQIEAMTMADRIVVMRDGVILQVGTPTELYESPADVFTARFIGSPSMNLLAARRHADGLLVSGAAAPLAANGAAAADALVGVRPHDLVVGNEAAAPGGLQLAGEVEEVEPMGAETLVHLRVGDAEVLATAFGRSAPRLGANVVATAAPGSLYLFDAGSERALGRA
jgi:multiple sugar transport system ATP-binding protein